MTVDNALPVGRRLEVLMIRILKHEAERAMHLVDITDTMKS